MASWGEQFYLVYLPESERYEAQFGQGVLRQRIYDGVHGIAARQGIPLIDLAAEFARDPKATGLYAFPGAHLNVEGYRRAADIIAAVLRGAKLSSLGGPKVVRPGTEAGG